MSTAPPPLPPLPDRSAADAARQTGAHTRPYAYDPASDPDDTGVPTTRGDADDIARGFFRSLFDLSFRTFIVRRLAAVFYFVGLMAIGIAFIVYLVSGVVQGIALLEPNLGAGVSLIVATVVLVPIATLLAIIALRFVIEAVVALIAIAENTERTAENTRTPGR